MEVTVKQNEYFNPVSIELVFDTAEQVNAFYALFNHSDVTDVVSKFGISDGTIRSTLLRETNFNIDYAEAHLELSKKFSARDKY